MNKKNTAKLNEDYLAQEKDYKFFEQGIPFTEVGTCSAKALFGGNWKNTVKKHLGEDILAMLADREGNKMIDFPVAALNVGENAKLVSKGEQISVICANNNSKYNGTYKILAIENQYIIILQGMDGSCAGNIINQSRKQGARNAMEKTAKRISKTEGGSGPSLADKDKKQDDTGNETKNSAYNGKNGKNNKGWIVLILLLIFMYFIIKIKK